MVQVVKRGLIIINKTFLIYRYSNETCQVAGDLYNRLKKNIGCTYLVYMYEDLINNEKFIYSSNQAWHDLFIDNLNKCPITLLAFKYLEEKSFGSILLPWHRVPLTSKEDKKLCALRAKFNIANGINYARKKNKKRESLAFGGELEDKHFYKNFIYNPSLLRNVLLRMRTSIMEAIMNKILRSTGE
jgi:hypothetical protein